MLMNKLSGGVYLVNFVLIQTYNMYVYRREH